MIFLESVSAFRKDIDENGHLSKIYVNAMTPTKQKLQITLFLNPVPQPLPDLAITNIFDFKKEVIVKSKTYKNYKAVKKYFNNFCSFHYDIYRLFKNIHSNIVIDCHDECTLNFSNNSLLPVYYSNERVYSTSIKNSVMRINYIKLITPFKMKLKKCYYRCDNLVTRRGISFVMNYFVNITYDYNYSIDVLFSTEYDENLKPDSNKYEIIIDSFNNKDIKLEMRIQEIIYNYIHVFVEQLNNKLMYKIIDDVVVYKKWFKEILRQINGKKILCDNSAMMSISNLDDTIHDDVKFSIEFEDPIYEILYKVKNGNYLPEFKL